MNNLLQPADLFQEANTASKHVIETCARSVLRQVALESLDQLVDIQESQVVLTINHLKSVQRHCRLVADAWSAKLKERGHYQAAESIQNVVRLEENDLYNVNERDEAKESALITLQQSTTAETPPSPAFTATTPQNTTSCITSLARIRQLTRQDILSPEPLDKETLLISASQQLEQFGRTHQTDWPFSWSIIERKVQEIPSRLYKNKREAPVIELIPKAVWETQQKQQQQQHGEIAMEGEQPRELSQEARQLILQRRRRNVNSHLLPAQKRARLVVAPVEDVPRPASMQPEKIDLTRLDQVHDISQYIHMDASTTDYEPRDACLLAPLINLGHTHYTRQLAVDNPTTNTWSKRQWQSAQHKAKKERLGLHNDYKDADGSKSRVRRTVDASGMHWMDFDLGRTLLELGPENDKKLYWFDSVEVILLDEDTSDALDKVAEYSDDERKLEEEEDDEGDQGNIS
jgi:hypothetical protein